MNRQTSFKRKVQTRKPPNSCFQVSKVQQQFEFKGESASGPLIPGPSLPEGVSMASASVSSRRIHFYPLEYINVFFLQTDPGIQTAGTSACNNTAAAAAAAALHSTRNGRGSF